MREIAERRRSRFVFSLFFHNIRDTRSVFHDAMLPQPRSLFSSNSFHRFHKFLHYLSSCVPWSLELVPPRQICMLHVKFRTFSYEKNIYLRMVDPWKSELDRVNISRGIVRNYLSFEITLCVSISTVF